MIKKTKDNKFWIWLMLPLVLVVFLTTEKVLDSALVSKYLGMSIYLFISIIIFFITGKSKGIKTGGLQICLLLYTAYVIGRSLFSPVLSDALFDASKIVLLSALTLFYSEYLTKEILSKILRFVVFIMSFALIYGLFQLADIWINLGVSHTNLYGMTSFFAHKNIFMEIVLLSLPIALFVAYREVRYWRWLSVGFAIVSIFLLTVAMTRAVWVAAAGAGFLSIVFLALMHKSLMVSKGRVINKKTLIYIFASVSVIIGTVIVYSQYDTTSAFAKQLENIANPNYGSGQERMELWKRSFDIFSENPVFGKGQGTWRIDVLKYGTRNLQSTDALTFYQRPHNDFIWILAEQGIVGVLLFLGVFILAIRLIVINLKNTEDNECRWLLLMSFYMLTSYLIFSMFSFPKERIEHIFFLALLFAIVNQQQEKFIWFKPFKVILTGIGVLLTFCVIIGVKRFQGESHLKKAIHAKAAKNNGRVIREIDQAESFFFTIDAVSTPLSWYRGSAFFNQKQYKKAEIDFDAAFKLNPYHIHVLNNLGACAEVKKQNKEALEYFNKALKINPYFEDALFNKTAVLYNMGKVEEASVSFAKIDPTTSNPKYPVFNKVINPSSINTSKIND